MIRYGIYPGSFNPWHEGHSDILRKALGVFERVIIARGVNPEKPKPDPIKLLELSELEQKMVSYREYYGLLSDFVTDVEKEFFHNCCKPRVMGVIRGLRNGHDLQYEMNLQYWNEDLGLTIPTVFFICDRALSHISSSALRQIEKFKCQK